MVKIGLGQLQQYWHWERLNVGTGKGGPKLKLGKIYEFVIRKGIEADPRGKELLQKELERVNRSYGKLKEEERNGFDKESLTNPYSDTRILYGDRNIDVNRLLVGIDIEVSEILLADRLNQKGERIDLIFAHHPEGRALAGFYEVMHMQVDLLSKVGVPVTVAEGLLNERIKEVERKVISINHTRAVDAAKLLDIPFVCVHTPSDNFVARYLQDTFDDEKPDTVDGLLNILKRIPEYKLALENKAGPKVVIGQPNNRAGRVFVEMTGGTEGSKEIFSRLSQAGVGTIICMHLSEEHFKNVQKEHINVVIAGHIASDNLGLNLLLDELEKEGQGLEILTCSGFQRIRR